MKKTLMVVLAVGALTAFAYTAASTSSGRRVLKLNPNSKKKRVHVDFSKHKAAGIKCTNCHRKHNNGNRHYKKCGKCHNNATKGKQIGHKLCRKCHRSRKSAGKKAGPTTCTGCHKH